MQNTEEERRAATVHPTLLMAVAQDAVATEVTLDQTGPSWALDYKNRLVDEGPRDNSHSFIQSQNLNLK